MKTALKTLFTILVFTSSISNTQALTKQEIAKTALNSTVVVVVNDKKGNTLQFGSGFVIEGGAVVSNHHVVAGGVSGYILSNNKAYKVLGVLASDNINDLVILKIDKHPIPPLSIHNKDDLKIGANVYVAGNPLGLSGTFSEGMLSSIRKIKNKQLYQITAPISQGSSGGPVLNDEASVIGVITSYITNGQNINFAVPNTYLNTLIENIRKLSPLSGISPSLIESNTYEISQSEIFKIKPKVDKEGKLNNICCAFGVELGKKLDANIKADNHSIAAKYENYFAKLVDNKPQKSFEYIFTPKNPYDKLTRYEVSLIDKDSLVYQISAYADFNNRLACTDEKLILSDILSHKYNASKRSWSRNTIHFEIEGIENRIIYVSCNKNTLELKYLDTALETLKEKIYKEKLRSNRDPSGL